MVSIGTSAPDAGLVNIDTSTPDAGPFASEDLVDSEKEFCGVLDPGGGPTALVNMPDESPSCVD